MTYPVDAKAAIRELIDAGLEPAQAETIVALIVHTSATRFSRFATREEMRDEFSATARVIMNEIAASRRRALQWLFASQALLLAAIVGLAQFTRLL